jgi:WD40 repeat protein
LDLATQREVASLIGHRGWISSLALALDESLLASGNGDGTVQIWDLKLRQENRGKLGVHARSRPRWTVNVCR